jgi:hypothetical protein
MPLGLSDAYVSVRSLLRSPVNSLNSHLDKFSMLNCEAWVIQANAAKGLTSVNRAERQLRRLPERDDRVIEKKCR